MSDVNYVRGPWTLGLGTGDTVEVSEFDNGNVTACEIQDGFVITAGDASPNEGVYPGTYHSINRIEIHNCLYPEDKEWPQALATARLVSAAPDLFEALLDVLPLAEKWVLGANVQPEHDAVAAALKAIAKAHGPRK